MSSVTSEFLHSTDKCKLVFLGEQSVGKSSLITRFIFNSFDENYQATIGLDFLSKTIYLNDNAIRLQIWDTAGQEKFRSLISFYIRGCPAAIVVYDVTNVESFQKVPQWIEEVRNERESEAVIMLVGNKIDLSDKRQVSTEEGANKAKELNVMFIETSAQDGQGVKDIFYRIVKEMPEIKKSQCPEEEIPILNETSDDDKKSSCLPC